LVNEIMNRVAYGNPREMVLRSSMRRIWGAALLLTLLFGCRGDKRSPLVEMARTAHGPELSHPIPIFTVADLRASQRYYRDALGFRVLWDHGDPPDFGAVGRGDTTLFMCQRCQGHPGAWIMVFAHDVDALHEELARRGALIVQPPTDMPWHLREMLVADPDGNRIRFGGETEHD
jgi:catechol 2,3-dioxygenase-like lactoylglutathione lyase family enzyme